MEKRLRNTTRASPRSIKRTGGPRPSDARDLQAQGRQATAGCFKHFCWILARYSGHLHGQTGAFSGQPGTPNRAEHPGSQRDPFVFGLNVAAGISAIPAKHDQIPPRRIARSLLQEARSGR